MIMTQLVFRFYSEETHTRRRIQASLQAKEQNSKEGKWLASDSASGELSKIYFGADAGWWQIFEYKESKRTILFLKEKTSRPIDWNIVLTLHDIKEMPLQLGQGGFGVQEAAPGHHFHWTVEGFVGVN